MRVDELRAVLDHGLTNLPSPQFGDGFRASIEKEFAEWEQFYTGRVGAMTPSQLKVLYLCGPEPLNDLNILISLGVNPHNVWAVTSSSADLNSAVAEVGSAGLPLKIHYGSLVDFFHAFDESFDVIYVDSCGPFTGGRPNTLLPILRLLTHQRLTPLAALVTTFSEIPKETDAHSKFVDTLTAYFRYRYRDLPRELHEAGADPAESEHDSTFLRRVVEQNVDLVYSAFITRFLVDLSRSWIPSCRALSIDDLFQSYVAPKKLAKSALMKATDNPQGPMSVEEFANKAGHATLSPSSYPLLSFFEQLKKMGAGSSLGNHLGSLKINGAAMGELLGFASILDHVFEGHWDCLSDKMKQAIAVSWFDENRHFGCDAPLPNLLVNSLLGMYGRPYFANPAKSLRLSYRAKANRMYCDLLLLDQCRYFYDWRPTIDLCPKRFSSLEFQVLARCMIDRISWHDGQSDNHPFRGGAVACWGEVECAKPYDFADREEVASIGDRPASGDQ